jgi:hypothetical protein
VLASTPFSLGLDASLVGTSVVFRVVLGASGVITVTELGLTIPLGAVSKPLPSGLEGGVLESDEEADAFAESGALFESDPTSGRAGSNARFGRSAFTGDTDDGTSAAIGPAPV